MCGQCGSFNILHFIESSLKTFFIKTSLVLSGIIFWEKIKIKSHFSFKTTQILSLSSSVLHAYFAGLLTVGVKGHLFGRQLSTRVDIVAEVNLTEGSSTEQLPLTPVHRSPWGYG